MAYLVVNRRTGKTVGSFEHYSEMVRFKAHKERVRRKLLKNLRKANKKKK